MFEEVAGCEMLAVELALPGELEKFRAAGCP
jgi:hypothetical protein